METHVFGLSFFEIGIILVVALLVLGPKKLPELAKSLGKGLREFRNATEDFRSTIDHELKKPEPKELPKPQPPAGPTATADEVDAVVEKADSASEPNASEPIASEQESLGQKDGLSSAPDEHPSTGDKSATDGEVVDGSAPTDDKPEVVAKVIAPEGGETGVKVVKKPESD